MSELPTSALQQFQVATAGVRGNTFLLRPLQLACGDVAQCLAFASNLRPAPFALDERDEREAVQLLHHTAPAACILEDLERLFGDVGGCGWYGRGQVFENRLAHAEGKVIAGRGEPRLLT